jgi:hypothetical protein
VHLVDFIIRIYHDARPSECQIQRISLVTEACHASCLFFLENLQVFHLVLGEGTRSKPTLYKNSADSCFNCEWYCFRLSFYKYGSLLSPCLVETDNEYTAGCCNYTGFVRSCRNMCISAWVFVIRFTLP